MMPHCFLVTGIAICRVPITVLGTETRKPSSACKPRGKKTVLCSREVQGAVEVQGTYAH